MMMRFPRAFRGYIANINILAAARHEPLKFSYFFQLHLLIAFVLALSLTPNITDLIQSAAAKLERIPQGITVEKKGDNLIVTGVAQPLTVTDEDFVMTVDTTGSIKERPASSTVFISGLALDVAPAEGREAQHILWKDGGDFKVQVDDIRNALVGHEAAAVTALTLLVFLYFFVSSLIFSVLLIVLWSALASVSYRMMFGEKVTYRDALAFHMVAITAPLVLWGICVVAGLGIAPVVEVIAFVVYSILGLRFGGRGIVPPAAATETK